MSSGSQEQQGPLSMSEQTDAEQAAIGKPAAAALLSMSEKTDAEQAIEKSKAAAPLSMSEKTDAELASLGKRARKRLERIEKQKANKASKKEAKREAKRQKHEEDVAAGLAQEPKIVDPEVAAAKAELNRQRRAEARAEFTKDAVDGPVIVFDMSDEWELAMKVSERSSLAQQVMYSYGFNKRAKRPARLLVSGMPKDGLVDRHLSKHKGLDGWLSFAISNRPLVEHLPALRATGDWVSENRPLEGTGAGAVAGAQAAAQAAGEEAAVAQSPPAAADVIYLTADAKDELDEVHWDRNTVYVLGAIVDRNRMTRAAAIRAEACGIRTARLPINKHLAMHMTPVLTVNHCVELLTRRGGGGETWPEALARTLPTRKDAAIKGAGGITSAQPSASAGEAIRPGDWKCPKCGVNVFGTKSKCFKCAEPRPRVGAAEEGGSGEGSNAEADGSAVGSRAPEEEDTAPPEGDEESDDHSGGDEEGDASAAVPIKFGSTHYEKTRVTRKRRRTAATTDPTYCRDIRFL